jgi:tetratricopeptide (TPR) repeat protein
VEFNYNAANALDQLGRSNEAIEEALRGRNVPEELAPAVEYALGNHYANAGRYLQAIEAYKQALFADPDDDDAKHNLEVARNRLTPSPTPTLEVPEGAFPTPGGDEPGGGSPGDQPGVATPQPGEAESGTPDPNAEPADPSDLTREDIQRALEEALAGIDEEFTEEEALRILELLNEENRRSVEESSNDTQPPGLPDY